MEGSAVTDFIDVFQFQKVQFKDLNTFQFLVCLSNFNSKKFNLKEPILMGTHRILLNFNSKKFNLKKEVELFLF